MPADALYVNVEIAVSIPVLAMRSPTTVGHYSPRSQRSAHENRTSSNFFRSSYEPELDLCCASAGADNSNRS